MDTSKFFYTCFFPKLLQGFKAQVTREPTDIVVKIPTPQPAQEQVQQYVTVSPILLCRTEETCVASGTVFIQPGSVCYCKSYIPL